MAKISHITTCKGRLDHLRQTLPTVASQRDVESIVVDYDCPDGTAAWVAANLPEVTVVRVSESAGFHLTRARNLGAAAATAPWLAFFDADIAWAPTFAEQLIAQLEPNCYFRANPMSLQTWGSVVCNRSDFSRIGGYDESFIGWGGEDEDLYMRLTMAGCRQLAFDGGLVREIPHGDDRRVEHYEVKNKTLQHRINILYLNVKSDLMCLHPNGMSADVRQRVYKEIKASVLKADRANLSHAEVTVNLPTSWMNPPPVAGRIERWPLLRAFTYRIGMTSGPIDSGPGN
ncbi:MAG: glycosyltransferase family 2 protein [Sulfuritalea sp.]|nr:glycosyltransferase family 2 protein [Sulfuritalea sp.]